MFNPYTIILSLFLLAGFFTTLWGLRIIIRAQKTRHWPRVDGLIEESKLSSDQDDLLPHIQFEYIVGDVRYQHTMKFSNDITPSQEFAKSYTQKYPVGAKVQVFYHPDNPEVSTLEPGLGRGDWLVFVIGIGTFIFGILFFLFR